MIGVGCCVAVGFNVSFGMFVAAGIPDRSFPCAEADSTSLKAGIAIRTETHTIWIKYV